VSKKPDGSPARTERVTFTKPAAERIAKVVRAVEGGDRDCGPLTFGARVGGVSGKVFRICTFTGSWEINASKVVTFKGVTTTPNTVSAINLFCGLTPSTVCDASIAKDGTAWYLVQPNLTQQTGYSTSGTQVLTVINGLLSWVGTTACT
jgi:hypothetical protein